jgi:hypothetical protein
LEYRPWPYSYRLGNKKSIEQGEFLCDDTYYFGIRVKNIGEVKE